MKNSDQGSETPMDQVTVCAPEDKSKTAGTKDLTTVSTKSIEIAQDEELPNQDKRFLEIIQRPQSEYILIRIVENTEMKNKDRQFGDILKQMGSKNLHV